VKLSVFPGISYSKTIFLEMGIASGSGKLWSTLGGCLLVRLWLSVQCNRVRNLPQIMRFYDSITENILDISGEAKGRKTFMEKEIIHSFIYSI
jgi:hypothetical protein